MGQYNKWLERENQLKLLKEEEERLEKKREELRLARELEDQKLAMQQEEKRIAKEEEQRLKTAKDQIPSKELEEGIVEQREEATTIKTKDGESDASIESDQEVKVQKKKAKKDTTNYANEISDHKSADQSSPNYTESKISTIGEAKDRKDSSSEKRTSPSKPQVFANPFFDSSSSSEDEKDKEQLVEMLYSLISDEKQSDTGGAIKKREVASKSDDDDLSSPIPEASESEKDFVPPTVMEDLPSKSAFDNLLGASSDVTVEALEDTLDTSELEATFVADNGIDNGNEHFPEGEPDKNVDSEVINSHESVDLSLLRRENKFEGFITVLELECAEPLQGRSVVDILELERMVQRALESLESKQLPEKHLEEDKRFMSQHSLREVQVNVKNVSLQNYFEEEHKKIVVWFKEEFGDKVARKQKLVDGLAMVRERFFPALDLEKRKENEERVNECENITLVENTGDKDDDNIKINQKKKRVLDSSDSEVELGAVHDEEEKSAKTMEDVSERGKSVERINNEDKIQAGRRLSTSDFNGKNEEHGKSSKIEKDVSKEVEKSVRSKDEDSKKGGKKHSNSTSHDDRDTVYRPGPVKSKKKSHEKEKIKSKNQKDKRWPEEKRMEKHHSQGFKIPRVSSPSGSDATNMVVRETELLGSEGKQTMGDGYHQDKNRGEKINQKKFERSSSVDKGGRREPKTTDKGEIMTKMNKLSKEKKPREPDHDDMESRNFKKNEKEKFRKEEKERRDKKSGKVKSGDAHEEKQRSKTS